MSSPTSHLNMTITLNGEERPLAKPCSIRELLDELGFGKAPVLVEQNGTALYPREFDTASLNDGDRIEIIRIVAGG